MQSQTADALPLCDLEVESTTGGLDLPTTSPRMRPGYLVG